MATPVYKFYSEEAQQDLFVIHNTYTELPHTIPMDLATFISYHFRTGRQFSGLFYCWNLLSETGASLSANAFPYESDVQNFSLVLPETDVIERAIANIDLNRRLKQYLDENNSDSEIRELFRLLVPFEIRRSVHYYQGRHHTCNWMLNNGVRDSLIDDYLNSNTGISNEVISRFINLYNSDFLSLDLVPHEIRNTDFFKSECERKNMFYLLKNENYNSIEGEFTHRDTETEELRSFFSRIKKQPFRISDGIRKIEDTFSFQVEEASTQQLETLINEGFFDSGPLYGFVGTDGQWLSDKSYIGGIVFQNEKFIALPKLGIQNFDILDTRGNIIISDDIYDVDFHHNKFISVQPLDSGFWLLLSSSDGRLFMRGIHEDRMELRRVNNKYFRIRENDFLGFLENDLTVINVNYDNLKSFSEGLIPACVGGKWGYLNEQLEFAIDPVFGEAMEFNNGKALVFILNDKAAQNKGIWVSDEKNEYRVLQHDVIIENLQIPRVPLDVYRFGKNPFNNRLAIDYHCFMNGIPGSEYNRYGHWAFIDSSGMILPDVVSKMDLEMNEIYEESQIDDADFLSMDPDEKFNAEIQNDRSKVLEYVDRNNQNIYGVPADSECYKDAWEHYVGQSIYRLNNLPDDLYANKVFAIKTITTSPDLYVKWDYFKNDPEIVEIAFAGNYNNYNSFPQEMKALYEERYLEQKRIQEETEAINLQEFLNANQTQNNNPADDDDLPF